MEFPVLCLQGSVAFFSFFLLGKGVACLSRGVALVLVLGKNNITVAALF